MSIVNDLNKINNIKHEIKNAIINKGVEMADNTPFADYPNKIDSIPVNVGGENELSDIYNLLIQLTNNGTRLSGLFAKNDRAIDFTDVDFSKITDATGMFYGYSNGGEYIDLALDLSNVTEANEMFANVNFDTVDINNLKLNLANLNYGASNGCNLFPGATGTLNLSKWDASSATTLKGLFKDCQCEIIDLTSWNPSQSKNMAELFSGCLALKELKIPNWSMSSVQTGVLAAQYTKNMFTGCSNLQKIDLSQTDANTINKIKSLIPARTLESPGEVLVPADTSLTYLNTFINNYWKPVGANNLDYEPTRAYMSMVPESIALNETAPIAIEMQPWYADKDKLIITVDGPGKLENNNTLFVPTGEGEVVITLSTENAGTLASATITVTGASYNETDIVFKTNGELSGGQSVIYNNGSYIYSYHMNNYYDSASDTYTISASPTMTSFRFLDGLNLKEVIHMYIGNMTSTEEMFCECEYLEKVDMSMCDFSKITSTNDMFYGCTNLVEFNPPTNISYDLDLGNTNINLESAVRVLENLATVDGCELIFPYNGVYSQLMSLHGDLLDAAQAKGWNTIEY